MPHALDVLLKPRTMAVVGASERHGSPGRTLAELTLRSSYRGTVFPVNPRYRSVLGTRCYPDLASLPEPAEHVVLALSNDRLEQALGDAIAHRARAATIFGSCVLDDDVEPVLRKRLQGMATEAGMAVCGGNGMGFYNVAEQLYAGIFPMPRPLRPGNIAFISQSGSAFSALAHNGVRLRFNLCVSTGNELTTSVADYMSWSLTREDTRVIALFLETVRDPAGFVRALEQAAASNVAVVMLKVGKSALGARMALTHTGAVAGNHAAYEALARRYRIIEVEDFGEMLATLQVLQSPRRPGTGALATIQESGGLMELATDIASRLGVAFADIEADTRAEIRRHLEPGLEADNPLDAWGSNADFENRFYHCLSALMGDRNVAAGMFVSNFRDGYYLSEAFFRVVERVSRESDKPLAITNCHGDLAHDELCRRSAEAGIPFIDGTREGMLAMRHLLDQRDHRAAGTAATRTTPAETRAGAKWRKRLSGAGPRTLGQVEAMALFSDFSIPTPRHLQVDSEAGLIAAAQKLGFPVVLKTAEPGIEHKSDRGGVVTDIRDRESLLDAYRGLCARLGPSALVCEMVEAGTELALGMINDPQFGPVVMLATGGVFVEILNDRTVRLAPLGAVDAEEMIASLESDALLRGARGRSAGHRASLIDTVVAFSRMCFELRDCIGELDINPVIVNAREAVAVDGLVVTR